MLFNFLYAFQFFTAILSIQLVVRKELTNIGTKGVHLIIDHHGCPGRNGIRTTRLGIGRNTSAWQALKCDRWYQSCQSTFPDSIEAVKAISFDATLKREDLKQCCLKKDRLKLSSFGVALYLQVKKDYGES